MYRGVDVRDVAQAHKLAMETELEDFQIFNISAQPIFTKDELVELRINTKQQLQNKIPKLLEFYERRQWEMPSTIDRVYVIDKAKRLLGYEPRYNIQEMLEND